MFRMCFPETSKDLRYAFSIPCSLTLSQEHKFKKNIKENQDAKFKKELQDFLSEREGKELEAEEINEDMQSFLVDIKKSKVHQKIVCEMKPQEEDDE